MPAGHWGPSCAAPDERMSRMSLCWNLLAPTRRAALVVASATCALFALAGSAQAALPTVTVSVGASSVPAGGPLQSGAVNVLSTSTKKEPEVILSGEIPRVSVAEVEAFVNSD